MAERMAEGTTSGPGPEGGAAPSGVPKSAIVESKIPANEVFANASLTDRERLQKARELLQTNLTPEQEQAILKAHQEAAGEQGRDNTKAGIYNYTQEQLLHKARILKEAGFSDEQRRALMEKGMVGILPPTEFVAFDPNAYAAEPGLQRIAQQILNSANEGFADEDLFRRSLDRLERLEDGGQITNVALADQLRVNLERWKIDAETKGLSRRPEQRPGPPSDFDNVLTRIDQLQSQPPSAQRDVDLLAAAQERDQMLEEANTQNLLRDAKSDLFGIYYEARVEITRRQKLATDEVGRPGKLRELAAKRQDATLNSWEQRQRFWVDPVRQALQARYGGVVDYFYGQSLDMIRAVVDDRHAALSPEMEDLGQLWSHTWVGENDVAYEMRNFEDVRERVEAERKKRYFVPNRGDYESWIQLVADDIDEFDESIPYVLDYIRTKFQSSDPNKVYGTVEQEQDKIIKALDKFAFDRGYEIGSPEYRRVRRSKSRLSSEINLLGAEEFAKLVHESWDPYLKFMGTIARGFRDTETQDHFVDAILLDNEGMTMLALDQFEANDGEYWRYGRNTEETQNNLQIGDGQRWQANRREEILNILVNYELRPMEELLQASFVTSTVNNVTTRRLIGEPTHPAFQRLKAQFDQLDQEDINAGRPLVDAAGNPKTRWEEYVEKAYDWQKNHTIGDPRDKKQRVLFQHPLARALTDQDSRQMYRPIQRFQGETNSQFNRRLREKRERMRTTIATALRIATAFQEDAHAGLVRHILTPDQKRELGLPVDDEVIPHNRIMRVMLERAIREDATKPPRRQRFKLTHVLQKMGLDRNLPLFSNWYLGANDTIRPGLLYNGVRHVPELMELLREKAQVRALDPDDYLGGDFKTSMSRMPEEEREFWEIMEVYVREKFPTYFNFPGQDTEGGGVKEMRNLLLFPYGQSWGTVELSSLVKNMWLGEQAFLPAFGCSTWKQFAGQAKGGNEVVFQRMGGLFESPRDAENWVKRIGVINEESKLLTSGDEKRGGNGILNDGWGSGFYKWRALNRAAEFIAVDKSKIKGTEAIADIYSTIRDPEIAYSYLDQKTYEAYINLAAQFLTPLIPLFQARLKLENVYGRSPGTAMFLNTLTWYSVSNWMDRNWEEYRGKFGNALDVDLYMARKFIRTFLYENRFIYYDNQWDEFMLGYTIPRVVWDRIQSTDWGAMTEDQKKKFRPIKKAIRYQVDNTGNAIAEEDLTDYDGTPLAKKGEPVNGETFEGILDAFPKEWRDEIIARNNQPDEPWIVPMGLNTEYPETLRIIEQMERYGDSKGMFNTYRDAVLNNRNKQTRQRKTVKRN